MHLAELHVSETFKAALVSYMKGPGLTPGDRSHLQRWSDDDRGDEEWQTINRAVYEHGLLLPANVFIREILAIRRVAEVIACRGQYRDLYRKYANQMEEIAKFLRKPHPVGMAATLPRSEELARALDDAAGAFRMEVEPSRDVPGVVKVTRKSDAPAVFTSQVSNYLQEITGRWLDDQAAVLTEIAFNDIGDVESEKVKWVRRKVWRSSAVSKPGRKVKRSPAAGKLRR
jgi:hypothetical protein